MKKLPDTDTACLTTRPMLKIRKELGLLGPSSLLEYKATAFEMFSQIIQKTPVHTGRARGDWNITTDSPDDTASGITAEIPGDYPEIFIANGLDYLVDLEHETPKEFGIISPAITAKRK